MDKLERIARFNRSLFSEQDPGLAILWNEAGLTQPIRGQASAGAAKAAVNAVITAAGMANVNDGMGGMCDSLWAGSMDQLLRAQDAVNRLQWTHRMVGIPDVGQLFVVTARGANNVAFSPSLLYFNQ